MKYISVRFAVIYVLQLAFWAYVVYAWVRWARTKLRFPAPKWRSGAALVGFCLASISVGLDVFLTIHAVLTGGYPFYHPVELACIRYGSLTAVLGFILGATGKGRLRIPSVLSSMVTLFLWFMDAMAQ